MPKERKERIPRTHLSQDLKARQGSQKKWTKGEKMREVGKKIKWISFWDFERYRESLSTEIITEKREEFKEQVWRKL